MSKNARPFRIRVNGTIMGRQLASPSGNWCYIDALNPTIGSPAIYEVVVILKRGLNTIDIGLNNTEQAPFIDKIKLEKAELNGLALEAELAELFGSAATVTCSVASNGAQVNMGAVTSNGIRYNNLVSAVNKNYEVDIYYITKVERNMRISINGESFTTTAFTSSGNWCFETSPVVAKKTIAIDFVQGANSIEFRPTGAEAPFIDRIVIREAVAEITSSANQHEVMSANIGTQMFEQSTANALVVYPNPVQAGAAINITLPDAVFTGAPALLQVTDVNGRVVYAQNLLQQSNRPLQLINKLNRGMYIVSIIQGMQRTSKKVVIQ